MRYLLWRMAQGVLPTGNALNGRGVAIEDKCGLCNVDGEDVNHLFLQCEVARRCWAVVGATNLLMRVDGAEVDWSRWCMGVINSNMKEKTYGSCYVGIMEREE
ncbi:hypothetical protein LINPERPRIM_LOCUS5802 [Linum perenne]